MSGFNAHRYSGGAGAVNLVADVGVPLAVGSAVLVTAPLWVPIRWLHRHHKRRPPRPLTPIQRTCARCHAPRDHRCVMWDGYGWRPLPYPHYERTLP